MKPNSMQQTTQTSRYSKQRALDRRGSTLLVVIALLAMLSLLGVVFYTFASQEERSAQYFTEASLNEADAGLDADVLFNWGLQQLIVGPNDGLYNSALYGKRHALLPNMFGSDLHPFSGSGINVVMDGSGIVAVDQDHNGTADNADFLNLNHSPAAYDGLTYPNFATFPEPDVDYTAPDINNLFLAYDGYTLQGGTRRRVVIPSFVRPQFFRNRTSGTHVTDWYENDGSLNSDDDTRTRVLRPHPAHVFVDPDGNATGTQRFANTFPFQPTTQTGGNATSHGELGIFTNSFGASPGFTPIVELDVDNDRDGSGIREGIWMDLDFPPIQNPNDATKYILPLFSFTVYDLDALLNLNTAGNMRRTADVDLNYDPSMHFFGESSSSYTDKHLFLSRSNMGLSSPGEINMQWALNARPATDLGGNEGDLAGSANATDVFMQHRLFFGGYPYPHGMIGAPRGYGSAGDFQAAYEDTVDWREISNMEYFFLNFGRPEFKIPSPLDNGTKDDISDLYTGRWGEPNRLYDAQRTSPGDNIFLVDTSGGTPIAFPHAGQTLIDDNGNRYEGGTLSGSLAGKRSNVHSFMHPLSYNGAGRINKKGASYRQASIGYYGWKGYEDFEFAGSTRYNGGRTFFKNSITDTTLNYGVLTDEPDEMTVDLEKVQRPYDEPFTADDLAFLHMNQTDQDETGVSSRLENLLPFNFGRSATVNIRGNSIRRKFTTMSWGRKQFSLFGALVTSQFNNGATAHLDTSNAYTSWLFSADTNNDGKLEFPPDFRSERDLDQDGTLNYQNYYGTTIGASIEDLSGDGARQITGIAGTTLDPFRSAVRTLLTVERGNTSTARLQMKLNLNQLVVYEQTGTGRIVTTRPLTPHPGEDVNDNGGLDAGEDLNGNGQLDVLPAAKIEYSVSTNWRGNPVGGNPVRLPSYPPRAENSMTLANNQEIWARYDRQLKARDIYVLLYTLGGRRDNVDYRADNSTNALYTNLEMREMAQFAVNLVDALDPDDVITRFEYDTNLHDGWEMDDNPYTAGESDRAEVFGVESQKLTLSEFLAIKADKIEDSSMNPVNHDATEYDDEKDRYFSFLELRNASHQTVSFANDAWQIRLEPRTVTASEHYADLDNLGYSDDWLNSVAAEPVLNDTHKRRLTLRSGFVGGGGVYNILSAGDNENTNPMSGMPRDSYFRVDPAYTGSGAPTLSTIVPRDTSTTALDLITDDENTDFRLTSEADIVTALANRGDFLNGSNTDPGSTNPSDLTFIVRLMRRAHLGRSAPGFSVSAADNDADNPWVEVDSMVVSEMKNFTLSDSAVAMDIQDQLNPLRSYERKQPLHARGTGQALHDTGTGGTGYRANTIGATNSKTGSGNVGADGANGISGFDDDAQNGVDDSGERGWAFSDDRPRFDLWQPHFDRDFASVVELLTIPLAGPNRITRDLATETGWQTRSDTTATVDKINDVRFAGIQKFLDPSGPDDGVDTDDNRWYRILEFVEVPTRMHRQLGNPLNDARVPGRINLNTLRHPSILAAMLDDTDAFTMDMTGSASHPSLVATHLGADWWQQFINSRDALDTNPTVNARIPGTPGSRPFRSFSYATGSTTASDIRDLRENTIFRSLPSDGAIANPRLLFEVATTAEHTGTGTARVDAYTRNRLLSKIAANTTTRSNTFIVFMSVAYFEATDTGTTVYGDPVQIGDRMSPIDPARDVNDPDYRGFFVIDRTRAEEAFEPTTGEFDHWKRLIRYRHQIE